MDGGAKTRKLKGRTHYSWGNFHPDLQSWAGATRRRLHDWGFNTVGAWSLPPRMLKMPAVIDLALGKRLVFLWMDPAPTGSLPGYRSHDGAGFVIRLGRVSGMG